MPGQAWCPAQVSKQRAVLPALTNVGFFCHMRRDTYCILTQRSFFDKVCQRDVQSTFIIGDFAWKENKRRRKYNGPQILQLLFYPRGPVYRYNYYT